MPTPDKLLSSGYPLWFVFGVILISAFLTFSRSMGEVKNVLGAASRWWYRRQEREVERSESIEERINKAVDARVERRLHILEDQIVELQSDLEEKRRDIASLKKTQDDYEAEIYYRDRYIQEQSRHIRNIEEWSIEKGYTLPPPPPPSRFTEWLNEELNRKKGESNDS